MRFALFVIAFLLNSTVNAEDFHTIHYSVPQSNQSADCGCDCDSEQLLREIRQLRGEVQSLRSELTAMRSKQPKPTVTERVIRRYSEPVFETRPATTYYYAPSQRVFSRSYCTSGECR